MAAGEKPYRVYRGGRTKGKVPLERRDPSLRRNGREPGQPARPKVRRSRRRWGWPKRIAVTLLVLIVVVVAWAVIGFLQFRSGVSAANKRVSASVRATLAPDKGGLLSNATNILLLGTDHQNNDQRAADFHSDSIMLLHTDPSRHRLVYLSIPRDLRVPIPGNGENKINAAMQIGGAALAVRTVADFTRLPVNHVMIIDFAQFRQLIDAIGGIDVNVPEQILANRFDCPYDVARCARWKGWRFAKGPQHMNGFRAMVYSRIRENQLDPSYTDITRGQHQQQVLRAVIRKLTGFGTFLRLPFSGSSYMKPLATDLSAWQLVELGWDMKRAPGSKALHCRLGGTSDPGGTSDIIGTEENIRVIGMVTGASAPQPPPPGSQFLPGCYIGNTGLH